MAVHFLTVHAPTVDEVSEKAKIKAGAEWASLAQLAKASRRYGLKVKHIRPLRRAEIIEQIKAGFPVLVLVKYDCLDTKDDPNQDDYKGAHFVLVVGANQHNVIFHDPDRLSGEEFGEFREKPWPVFETAHGSTAETKGNSFNYHGMVFSV
jgi:ABC-type bacteriocin/lantibiotic exporter with double-glycine peptidase domain